MSERRRRAARFRGLIAPPSWRANGERPMVHEPRQRRRWAVAVLVGAVLSLALAADLHAQPAKGEPVNIGVGYFPSWNGGWSGVVIKKKELWKKHLPAGSTVRWDVVLVGFPVFNGLLANKLQIGYLGDAPAMVGTTKRETADLRIVSL